jgi:hypothetical protein
VYAEPAIGIIGRARVIGGGLPREHEDAGADDGADAEHDQMARAEGALQAGVGRQLRLERGDVLTAEKTHHELRLRVDCVGS